MKNVIVHGLCLGAVGSSFLLAGKIDPVGWRILALCGANALVMLLFIPRWPRSEALRQVFKVREGQKIEVEGR